MKTVKLHDKVFEISIERAKIEKAILSIAEKLNDEFIDKEPPIFLSILNGSFMFTSDLLKMLNFNSEVSFLKLSSYSGTSTTGEVKELIGFNKNIEGKIVIVLEDIVDTGITLEKIIESLKSHNPKEIRLATMLFKPEAYQKSMKLDYVGMEIPNDFIVGYGLDYDELGRNLPDIYTLKK